MPEVITYAKSGQPVLNGGAIVSADKLGNHQYIGPTGIHKETAQTTYDYLNMIYSGRFDDHDGALLLE